MRPCQSLSIYSPDPFPGTEARNGPRRLCTGSNSQPTAFPMTFWTSDCKPEAHGESSTVSNPQGNPYREEFCLSIALYCDPADGSISSTNANRQPCEICRALHPEANPSQSAVRLSILCPSLYSPLDSRPICTRYNPIGAHWGSASQPNEAHRDFRISRFGLLGFLLNPFERSADGVCNGSGPFAIGAKNRTERTSAYRCWL